MTTAPEQISNLKKIWSKFQIANPNVRIRDAAECLGVSECELLMTGISESVLRLKNNFRDLLHELHKLGRVMALSRNDEIVHERKGVYENAQTKMPHGMALFVNPDIDLRIFTNRWKYGFAVSDDSTERTKRSLQFFDEHGTAIHKIYLTEQSDLDGYENLVEQFKAEDQTDEIQFVEKTEKTPDLPDSEIDVEGFRKAWAAMQDTHDFFSLLNKFGVGRRQALRLADTKFSTEVQPDSFKKVLEMARDRKIPVMIFVGNAGIIQIHTGEIENLVEARGWFNVLDENFNLHVRQEMVGAAYVVRKPTADGIVTSLEIFNKSDDDIAFFFGKRKPGIPEREDWRTLIADLEVAYSC